MTVRTTGPIVNQIWVFRKTGARYKIIRAVTTFGVGGDDQLMLENVVSKRRHWVSMPGLLKKYEKAIREVHPDRE